jgi:hypothetical protein
MTVAERRKLTELELDLRIRDRLLASGALKPEEMEGYLAGLPDLAAQADAMNVDQPALGLPLSASRADAAADDSEGIE